LSGASRSAITATPTSNRRKSAQTPPIGEERKKRTSAIGRDGYW